VAAELKTALEAAFGDSPAIVTVEVHLTQYGPGGAPEDHVCSGESHATVLAYDFAEKGTGIISIGGDGTIHEIMKGLIKKGMLKDVPLGLISRGTMNLYAISGGLPSAQELPNVIMENSFRNASLMKVTSPSSVEGEENIIDDKCFEALYFGVGYAPAKGAQAWRSTMGPMFGIMTNLVYACMVPSSVAIRGKMTLHLKDGTKEEIDDTFFWIIVSMRNPYSGRLTEDLWVSYMTLDNFPGFSRMMDYFTPPMELYVGCATVMQAHFCVSSFSWNQVDTPIGVCLDGDARDASQSMTVELEPNAWKIMASKEYPTDPVEADATGQKPEAKPLTECAKAWLAEHDPVPGKLPLIPQYAGYKMPEDGQPNRTCC